jgi:hypothetical protein
MLFGVAGVLIGLGASWLSGQFGSSCAIMCNPYIAGTVGGVLGVSMAVAD